MMEKKSSFFLNTIFVSLIFAFFLVGCQIKETELPMDVHEVVYLIDPVSQTLKPVIYKGQMSVGLLGDEPVELVSQIIDSCQNGVSGSGYEPSVSDKMAVEQINIFGSSVFINFNESYYLMTPLSELMSRTAIVRSITSFDAFKEVEFFIDGKPLAFDDVQIGRMTRYDALLSFDEAMDRNEEYKTTIYYPDRETQKLKMTEADVEITPDKKIEEIILNQLWLGEDRIFDETIQLLNVYTHNGICIVDFSSGLLNMTMTEGLNQRLIIYAIVNSLTDLDHVSSVQILIEGNVVTTFQDKFNMNRLFEKNYALIEYDS